MIICIMIVLTVMIIVLIARWGVLLRFRVIKCRSESCFAKRYDLGCSCGVTANRRPRILGVSPEPDIAMFKGVEFSCQGRARPNLSAFVTFAAAPLVLTSFVRKQAKSIKQLYFCSGPII